MGVKQAIKNLDAFPRAEEHLLHKTQSGALGFNLSFFPFLFLGLFHIFLDFFVNFIIAFCLYALCYVCV